LQCSPYRENGGAAGKRSFEIFCNKEGGRSHFIRRGEKVNLKSSIFIALVILVGSYFFFDAVIQVYHSNDLEWIILALLIILLGMKTVPIPKIASHVSVSDTIIFTSVLIYSPSVGVILALFDALNSSRRITLSRIKILFNICVMMTSIGISAKLFYLAAGCTPGYKVLHLSLNRLLLPMGILTIGHYLINSMLVATVLALQKKVKVFQLWKSEFLWTSISFFAGGSAAIMVYGVYNKFGTTAIIISIPIVLITYFTYKTYFEKVRASHDHISQMAELYLSTIESLTMAIDAKDQLTYGHVRRVQLLAVGLSQRVGITDEKVLEGIKAAALLHDIGKLAVPEHILNKPGKLTSIEFAKITIHPVVGSEILSNVHFPYPVVPYVRHHHERYDGKGYPDQLKGDKIPLGARILAVVDCYDALRSERPYRKKYSREIALDIIQSEKKKAFDPELVDIFVSCIDELEAELEALEISELNFQPYEGRMKSNSIAYNGFADNKAISAFRNINLAQKEVFSLYEFLRSLAFVSNSNELKSAIEDRLNALVHYDACVFYGRQRQKNENEYAPLWVISLSGSQEFSSFAYMSRYLPQEGYFSQKVLSNDTSSITFPGFCHKFNSIVSFPLGEPVSPFGFLNLYRSDPDGFNDDHIRILQEITQHLTNALINIHEFEHANETAMVDRLTGLFNSRYLFTTVNKELRSIEDQNRRVALYILDLDRFKMINDTYGHLAGDRFLCGIAGKIKELGSENTTPIRYAGDEFVIMVKDISDDESELQHFAECIRDKIESFHIKTEEGILLSCGASVGWAVFPKQANSIEELLALADSRMYYNKAKRKRSTPAPMKTGR
jgi:diguanylate cyclase (GGDEF)-like protein/putative nucleotidyltransferase with HDIG domain